MLDGKKTYVTVILGMFFALMFGMGYIEYNTFILLLSFVGFGSVAALRIALKKIFEK